jgi:AcrR family transcriptional regulator
MAEDQKKHAKQRIFDAAVSLFARKGFSAVGIREIAKTAHVNISMINYYFGEKVGILKAIIDECYDKYYRAIHDCGDEATLREEHVRLIIKNLIAFFRENTEIAMVSFNAMPVDIPAVLEIKCRWVAEERTMTTPYFREFGLNTDDSIQMNFIRGLLTTIITEHFRCRYTWEHVMQRAGTSQVMKNYLEHDTEIKYDDHFYEQFAELLTKFYVYGVSAISHQLQSKEK